MSPGDAVVDNAALRKARGAFFAPPALCDYICEWAIQAPTDTVLEPSCGEAAFLAAAAGRLDDLGADRADDTRRQRNDRRRPDRDATAALQLPVKPAARSLLITAKRPALAPGSTVDLGVLSVA